MKRFIGLAILFLVCAISVPSPMMAQTPGKTLVYAAGADPDSLDPANALGNPSEAANRMIYENLVRFDEKLKLLPGLATDVENIQRWHVMDFFFEKGR